jgi:hypothetical protein
VVRTDRKLTEFAAPARFGGQRADTEAAVWLEDLWPGTQPDGVGYVADGLSESQCAGAGPSFVRYNRCDGYYPEGCARLMNEAFAGPVPGSPVPASAIERLTLIADNVVKANGGVAPEWVSVVVTTHGRRSIRLPR